MAYTEDGYAKCKDLINKLTLYWLTEGEPC